MNRMPSSKWVVVLFVSSLISACGAGSPRCESGESTACTCTGGETGTQVCEADGRFGECACEGGSTGGGSAATGGGVGAAGGGDGSVGGGDGSIGGGVGSVGGGVGSVGGGVGSVGGGVGSVGGGVGTIGGGVGTTGGGSATDGGIFVPPVAFPIPLSPLGPDQLLSVTAGVNGSFYAAGYASASVGAARTVVVVKILASGALDTTFGNNGIATLPITFAGGDDEIDIATQPDGKIIVSATIANGLLLLDRDVAVVRLLATGTVDTTFGNNGIRVVDLSTGITISTVTDAARGLAIDASGRIYLHAASRGEGLTIGLLTPRTDSDFTIARLTADGALDTTWANQGKISLDIFINATHSNAVPQNVLTLGDGSIVAVGYTLAPNDNQPVVIKLDALGALDVTFGIGGLFHQPALAPNTDLCAIVQQGTNFVLAGTNRMPGAPNSIVALRLTGTGEHDEQWGSNIDIVDPTGGLISSIARAAVTLPNDKVLIVGSAGGENSTAQDGALVVLDVLGGPDTAYGTGIHVLPFGSNGIDQLASVAVSGNQILAVGVKGAGLFQSANNNDDSFGVLLQVQ